MDYIATSKSDINEIKMDIDYMRAGQQNVRNAVLRIKNDCFTGACKLYQLTYETNSETLGTNFKYVKADYYRKVENGFNEVNYNIDFKRGDEINNKNVFLNIKHDCSTGMCNQYYLKYHTDSEILSYFFRSFDVDYVADIKDGMADIKWDMEYRLKNDPINKNFSLAIKTDCIGMEGNCHLYKVKYSTDSEFLGTNFRYVDLEYNVKLNKDINEITINADYIRGASSRTNNVNFLFQTDCSYGLCRFYKLAYKTDSEFLGQNFKNLNVEYKNEVKSVSNLINLTVDVETGKGKTSKTKLFLDTNCFLGDCTVYKLAYDSNSEILSYNFKKLNIDFKTNRLMDGTNEIYYVQKYLSGQGVDRYAYLKINSNCFRADCTKYKVEYKSNEIIGPHFFILNMARSADNQVKIDVKYNNDASQPDKSANINVKLNCNGENCNVDNFEFKSESGLALNNFKVSNFKLSRANLGNNVDELDFLLNFNDGKDRTASFNLKTDCPKGKCHVYHLIYKTDSDVLGRNFKVKLFFFSNDSIFYVN